VRGGSRREIFRQKILNFDLLFPVTVIFFSKTIGHFILIHFVEDFLLDSIKLTFFSFDNCF
jgi:hypothetical protein